MDESSEDPAQRLAEALRAKASRAPGAREPGKPFSLVADSDFELLSGTEYGGTYPYPQTARPAPAASAGRGARPHAGRVPAIWVLAIALLLGLAAGAVAGVMTVL